MPTVELIGYVTPTIPDKSIIDNDHIINVI
jgi:hypothetical protein